MHTKTGEMFLTYWYMLFWIMMSAGVIMLNKYILDPGLGGFPFPLALTAIHMAFCSAVAWGFVRLGMVDPPEIPTDVYLRCILPIGGLFAAVLWTGNAAYISLSVSFIQMLKASMPMLVYAAGAIAGTESVSLSTICNLAIVVAGIVTASYGEVVFVLAGVLIQGCSMVLEAARLTLVQLLLQARGIKLNPITTLYHVAPVCLAFLLLPLATLEAERVASHQQNVPIGLLLLSATAAFALNCSVFLLIGRTSALTLNIAGVVKDVMLIGLSISLLGSVVTNLQVTGYTVALCGAFYYNYNKATSAAILPTRPDEVCTQPQSTGAKQTAADVT